MIARITIVFLVGCLWAPLQASAWEWTVPPYPAAPSANSNPVQAERDNMLSLAVLDMVYRDWQSDITKKSYRGHNIGSILVDKNSIPVFWARNAVGRLDDSSQHGEVRTIQAFLECPGIGKYVDGYKIYTTLEPCAMCTGMMAMTKVSAVTYVQVDPEYGGAPEALAAIGFPRQFLSSTPVDLSQKKQLEQGWSDYKSANPGSGTSITDYLASIGAKEIYKSAYNDLINYSPKYPENKELRIRIINFLDKTVTRETYHGNMLKRCPKKPKPLATP
jgi:tRNA(Arg) A34 adenosine deaminase TadA